MVTVNSEISRILKDKDLMIKSGIESIIGLLEELQKQVLDELGRAAIGSWDAYHLKQALDSINYQVENFRSKAINEAGAQLQNIWQTGASLVDVPLAAGGIYTGFGIPTSLLDTLKDFGNVQKVRHHIISTD